MKKILIACYGLGIGGIEKCLVNFLNALDEKHYEVDVLLMNPEHDLVPQVRFPVHYLETFSYVFNTTEAGEYVFAHKKRRLMYCVFRLMVKLRLKAWKTFKPLGKEYDIAIAYSQNGYAPYYVVDKVCAKRKVLWYHNGAYEKSGKALALDKQYYNCYDYVVGVSQDCASMLQRIFQFPKERLIVLHNFYDAEEIENKSKECLDIYENSTAFHITTVGRLTREKGADVAIEACSILKKRGHSFCWHWVGDGSERKVMQEKIRELGLEQEFVIEGMQENPYPFMRRANLYVQPSYFEAYSTTIAEAKILGCPIVTTDVGGMREQIQPGISGLIVPIDSEELANAVESLIQNPQLCEKLSLQAKKQSYSTQQNLDEYMTTVLS